VRILITNHVLESRGGTELFVRDLAGALIRAGDSVSIYSPWLGPIADECRALGAFVTDRMRAITQAPDVIHGHHYRALIDAAVRFPYTPIVYVCHGVFPPQECPIKLSTIKKYVGVSRLTRARISEEIGVDLDDIAIVSNFVDLNRFRTQRRLPLKPKKALLFGNHWRSDSYEYQLIAGACGRSGITSIDIRGWHGTISTAPENELSNYDVVFAVGRSAIEAMASGCAVILVDQHGIGGMVTPSNFSELRLMNFALEATRGNPITEARVCSDLLNYSRFEASAVTARVRSELSLETAAETLRRFYLDALNSSTERLSAVAAYATLINTKWRFREGRIAFAASGVSYLIDQIVSRITELCS